MARDLNVSNQSVFLCLGLISRLFTLDLDEGTSISHSFPITIIQFSARICPGRYFADKTIFIAVASILHVFTISHATDANGDNILLDGEFTRGGVVCVADFFCNVWC